MKLFLSLLLGTSVVLMAAPRKIDGSKVRYVLIHDGGNRTPVIDPSGHAFDDPVGRFFETKDSPVIPRGKDRGRVINTDVFRPAYFLPEAVAKYLFQDLVPASEWEDYHFIKNFRHTESMQSERSWYYAAIPKDVNLVIQSNVYFPVLFFNAAHSFRHYKFSKKIWLRNQSEGYRRPGPMDPLPIVNPWTVTEDVVVSTEAARPDGQAYNPVKGLRLHDMAGRYSNITLIGSVQDYVIQLKKWRLDLGKSGDADVRSFVIDAYRDDARYFGKHRLRPDAVTRSLLEQWSTQFSNQRAINREIRSLEFELQIFDSQRDGFTGEAYYTVTCSGKNCAAAMAERTEQAAQALGFVIPSPSRISCLDAFARTGRWFPPFSKRWYMARGMNTTAEYDWFDEPAVKAISERL